MRKLEKRRLPGYGRRNGGCRAHAYASETASYAASAGNSAMAGIASYLAAPQSLFDQAHRDAVCRIAVAPAAGGPVASGANLEGALIGGAISSAPSAATTCGIGRR